MPKEVNLSSLSEFQTMSLLNLEGKVFLGILVRTPTLLLMNNEYVDTYLQKGAVPGVPGCIEHNSVIAKIIEDTKRNRVDLAPLAQPDST